MSCGMDWNSTSRVVPRTRNQENEVEIHAVVTAGTKTDTNPFVPAASLQ
jgi:hypothetical protein